MTKKKLIPLSVVGVVLLAVAGWKSYGWWLAHKLDAYKAELAARGEKLSIQELMAERREPASNQADFVLQALMRMRKDLRISSNPPPMMKMILPGRALVGWKLPLVVGKDYFPSGQNLTMEEVFITNTWAEFAENLELPNEGLDQLRELVGQPAIDFHLDFTRGADLLLPHLAPMKQGIQTLSYSAMTDLHHGKTARAAHTVRSMIALSEGFRDEPLGISQLVRAAMMQIPISTTWELSQAPDVSDTDLKAIQADFDRVDFRKSLEQSLVMERAMGNMMIRQFREKGRIFGQGATPAMGGTPVTTISGWDRFEERAKQVLSPRELQKNLSELVWQSALSYEDEMRHLKAVAVVIDGVRASSNRCYFEVVAETRAKMNALTGVKHEEEEDGLLFCGVGEDSLSNFRTTITDVGWAYSIFKKVGQTETFRSLVATAIALNRYKLRHGEFPDELAKLTPDFLVKPARDPVDGQLLRYRREADGRFTLYSVGEDGVDNGGDPSPGPGKSPHWQKGRDWVWPQPATPAEIQEWERTQNKSK